VRLTRKEVPFDFNSSYAASFETLKERLLLAPLLAYYDANRQCMLETDASNIVVAVVFL
jgi:hypothetical protein